MTVLSQENWTARIAESKARIDALRTDIDNATRRAGQWGSKRHADLVTELHAEYRNLWRYEDALYQPAF